MRILGFAALALLGGCAITSMDAKIAPDTNVAESTIGHHQRVGVMVTDERPNQDLGKRSAMGARIKMKQDLAAVYQSALINGLSRKGFDPVAGGIEGPTLKVEIRGLSYDTSTGWFTAGIKIDSAIKAYTLNVRVPYEQMYRSGDADRAVFVPGAKDNNKRLNEVVSETLHDLLNDQKLLEVLAAG